MDETAVSIPRVSKELNDIFDFAGELKPDLFREKLKEYRRGGLPAGSSGGRGSGDVPIPVTQTVIARDSEGSATKWGPIGQADATDRALAQDEKDFYSGIRAAWTALAGSVNAYRRVTLVTEDEPDEPLFECSQPGCKNVHERKNGMCGECRRAAMREAAKESA